MNIFLWKALKNYALQWNVALMISQHSGRMKMIRANEYINDLGFDIGNSEDEEPTNTGELITNNQTN